MLCTLTNFRNNITGVLELSCYLRCYKVWEKLIKSDETSFASMIENERFRGLAHIRQICLTRI